MIQCPSGKRPYYSKSLAKRAVKKSKHGAKAQSTQGRLRHAYRCGLCGDWHVTSQTWHPRKAA